MKISVCVATYNGEKYIKEQLLSVLKNIKEDDEIIISDDGSTDDTIAIIKEMAENEKRINLIAGPRLGVLKNFENAISIAQGDIVFLCDQDDVWVDNKVNEVLKIFEKTNCLLVIHNASIVNEDLTKQGLSFFEFKNSGKGFWKNLWRNTYIGCCMAFKKSMFNYILPIPENVPMHDQWIGLLAENKGKVEFLDEELLLYRRHGDNASGMTHLPLPEMIKNRLVMLHCIRKRIGEK